jgi:hypothetical protein
LARIPMGTAYEEQEKFQAEGRGIGAKASRRGVARSGKTLGRLGVGGRGM